MKSENLVFMIFQWLSEFLLHSSIFSELFQCECLHKGVKGDRLQIWRLFTTVLV